MLFSVLMGGSCCRKTPPVVSIPPKKPTFSIESSYIAPLRYLTRIDTEFGNDQYKDSVMVDSVFYMYRPNANVLFAKQSYNFRLVYDNVIRLNKIEWLIGNDTRLRTGEGIGVDFSNPTGRIPIKCFVNYTYKVNDFEFDTKSDTIIKFISITGIDSVNFNYRGVDTRFPNDTLTIKLSWDIDSALPYPRSQKDFHFRGLPKDYPYAPGLGLTDNFFNFMTYSVHDDAWPVPVNGKYIINLFGHGFLKNNFDSVFIRYYYSERPTKEWTPAARSRMGEFVGKRVL